MTNPTIGQEVETPHGLGRIVAYADRYWKVRLYHSDVETEFDLKNCRLVPIFPEVVELPGTTTERAQAAIEGLIFSILREHSSPDYKPDWDHPFPKWLPYYEHSTGRFSLTKATTGQVAPNSWYWPRGAWQAVIDHHPEELKIFMGVE